MGISWEKILLKFKETLKNSLTRVTRFEISEPLWRRASRERENEENRRVGNKNHSLVLFMAVERSSFFLAETVLVAGCCTIFSWSRSAIAVAGECFALFKSPSCKVHGGRSGKIHSHALPLVVFLWSNYSHWICLFYFCCAIILLLTHVSLLLCRSNIYKHGRRDYMASKVTWPYWFIKCPEIFGIIRLSIWSFYLLIFFIFNHRGEIFWRQSWIKTISIILKTCLCQWKKKLYESCLRLCAHFLIFL